MLALVTDHARRSQILVPLAPASVAVLECRGSVQELALDTGEMRANSWPATGASAHLALGQDKCASGIGPAAATTCRHTLIPLS